MIHGQRIRGLFARQTDPPHPLLEITEEDRRYVTSLYDDAVPLPPEAGELDPGNPRLAELRSAYRNLDLPVVRRSRWETEAVDSFLDLRWFRGETLFVWHYRERPRISRLKYFIYMNHVRDNDHLGLLSLLEEDGKFGCWTFTYPGWGTVSRDLLQSVGEINFLDRALGLSRLSSIRVLDIGAGYGRLAHRMSTALKNIEDYCCVDVVPEATFLSDWYLRYRRCVPPARVVRLDRLQDITTAGFTLAVNMHSFSECPLPAIRWWAEWLGRLEVPNLLIVPNEPDTLLSTERDGTRLDFTPVLSAAGYTLACREPVIGDPAVRDLLPLHDHFYLFTRT